MTRYGSPLHHKGNHGQIRLNAIRASGKIRTIGHIRNLGAVMHFRDKTLCALVIIAPPLRP